MSKISDILKFEGFNLKEIGKKIKDNPLRVLYGGIDPASTKLWNTVLGRDDEPLVDQWGGASSDTYGKAEAAGIDTRAGHGMHRIARSIAGAIAGGYGMDALGGAGGGQASSGTGGITDLIGNIGLGGGGAQQAPIQSEVKPVDSEVGLTDNDFLSQYNSNQGRFDDGHKITVRGSDAFLYDAQGRLIGQAPNGPGLNAALKSMQED